MIKKIILILIFVLLISSVVAKKPKFDRPKIPFESHSRFCGIMIRDKLISYSKDPECFCPRRLNKVTLWIKPYCPPEKLCAQYFFSVYTCELKKSFYIH